MSSADPPFAVSQFTTWYQTFEEDIALYSRLGVGGIEVCERKLSTDASEAADQLQMLKESGLNVTSVQPRVHALFTDGMCPDIADYRDRVPHYRATIDRFAAFCPGQNVPLVAISGVAPQVNYREAHRIAREEYPKLAAYAREKGVRMAYEPLTPVMMNLETFICTLDGAAQLIDDVASPSFGMNLDVWHVWDEPDINRRLAAYPGEKIFVVHVNDWPKGGPRCIGDRVLPGKGVIDLPAMLGALERSGYNGAYCLEIFSNIELPDSLYKADPVRLIEEGRAGVFEAWKKRH